MINQKQNDSVKRFNGKKYYLSRIIIKNHIIIINGKNGYDQPIDSDIKHYKEIKRLKADQGKYYARVCFFRL